VLPSARKGLLNTVQRHYGPDGLRRNCAARQVPHAHHVVGRAGERKDPIDFQRSAMPHFAEQRNGLQPAERIFDALPLFLGGEDESAGNHAFRRFRNTFLRKNHVPDDLIQFWLGHAGKRMTDDDSAVRDDLKYRKMVAEQVGIGFELPLQAAPIVLNIPKSGFAVEAELAVNCSEVSHIQRCARSSAG